MNVSFSKGLGPARKRSVILFLNLILIAYVHAPACASTFLTDSDIVQCASRLTWVFCGRRFRLD